MGWITAYEPHIIVERFNAVMRGFCEYYTDFITYRSLLNRWMYIIRWAAIKTLAHKYNTKIRKIMRSFASPEGLTIPYYIDVKDRKGGALTLKKTWTLLSIKDAIGKSRKQANIPVSQKLKSISKGEFVFTARDDWSRTLRIMDQDFLGSLARGPQPPIWGGGPHPPQIGPQK
ncbi:MAG: group II intron reverse transcriptase/maturase, partial [Agrobacterium sp.]|uniref:group II intron reverse transcriptase/maturase n=1 Tax=Agrobacterium sp. TaxID=361 RepID=UPI00403842A8